MSRTYNGERTDSSINSTKKARYPHTKEETAPISYHSEKIAYDPAILHLAIYFGGIEISIFQETSAPLCSLQHYTQ